MVRDVQHKSLILAKLPNLEVVDMSDGGMGSLEFTSNREKEFGGVLVEEALKDADGVPVMVSIILDNHGELYELEMWKVDFSAVKNLIF